MSIHVPRRRINGPYPVVDWVGPTVCYIPQHLPEWCWAACIEMVMTSYSRPIEQCQLASSICKKLCCTGVGSGCEGTNPTGRANPEECNVPASPRKNDDLWKSLLGGRPQRVKHILEKSDLVAEVVTAGRPVELWCRLCESGSSHLVLVVAYAAAQDLFKVHDPCRQKGALTYDSLKKYTTYWVWEETWCNLG